MKVTIESRPPKAGAMDVCLLFACEGERVTLPGQAAFSRRLDTWLRDVRFSGRTGEIAFFPTGGRLPARYVLVAGLGPSSTWGTRQLKYAAGCAGRRLSGLRLTSCHAILPAGDQPAALVEAFGLGFRRGCYSFRTYRSAPAPRDFRLVVTVGPQPAPRAAVRKAGLVADAMDRVADLANAGGNDSTPAAIAAFARRLARSHGLRCTVWDQRRLARERCRAHLAVGMGSAHPPCLIRLDYRPRRPRGGLVALVGKTITFDSGGLSIKPAKSMESMKFDKCGGMAVLAVMMAAARLELDRPLTGFLVVAENMTGSRAQRPGDIVRTRKGLTVEVLNTDAEGRLVLADALDVAAQLKPETLIDLATLTGAAVTALGHECSAILGQPRDLLVSLMEAGERCGERLWNLPLHTEYRALIRSPVADLRNIGDGTAGTIVGGMFLRQFVPAHTPWAHLDLTHAWEERDQAHMAAGANLFGVHLILNWLQQGTAS